jgi:hypothetical protein
LIAHALAVLLLAGPRLDVKTGAGADSNAFELPENPAAVGADSPQPGVFVPLDATVDLRSAAHRMFRIEGQGWVDGEIFTMVRHDAAGSATRPSDASLYTGYVSMPLIFDPLPARSDAPKADLEIAPFASLHHETFTSHLTGLPYVFDDGNGFVSLADRFDYRRGGVKADTNVEITRDLGLLAGGQFAAVDYASDYASSQSAPNPIDSWDYREWRLDLDGYATPGDWQLGIDYGFKRRDYDSRFPRDASGITVTPVTAGFRAQVFDYHDVTLRAGWSGTAGQIDARYQLERRVDRYAGYLDYLQQDLSVDGRVYVGAASTLEIEPKVSVRRYDRAHVNFDPAARESAIDRYELGLTWEWALPLASTSLFVSTQGVHQSSSNAEYTYDSGRVTTGVHVTLR